MTSIVVFQIIQIILLGSVALFISESSATRIKSDPFPPLAPYFIQLLYLWFLTGYMFVLFGITARSHWDTIALMLMVLAALLIVRSIKDKNLFKIRTDGVFEPIGIYNYLRHPIYTGVALYLFSMLLVVAIHADFIVGLLTALPAAGLLVFLYANAQKEEAELTYKYGEQFILYKETVYAILPLKRNPKAGWVEGEGDRSEQ